MITNKDIEKYKHLVFKIVNEYKRKTFNFKTQIDWNEMEQVGLIALYNALKHFNPDKGIDFVHYASPAIYRALIRQNNFDKRIEQHSNIDEFYNIPDTKQDNIDDKIISKVFRDKIENIIPKLNINEKTKQILLDRLNGSTLEEIVNKYNIPYQEVANLITKHKKKIRDRLIKKGDI